MPPPLLVEAAQLRPDSILAGRDEIYARLPQRYEFMQLDGVCHFDAKRSVGVAFRNIRSDEWWARGHVPQRPIFPGVLMLESAAQTAAYFTKFVKNYDGFMAFGGVDQCKFREAVFPPSKLYLACEIIENRSRRIVCHVQGMVEGRLVFEAKITGLALVI